MDYILKRIDKINNKNLDTTQFYSTDIEITYSDLTDIWKNFIEKKYLTVNNDDKIDIESDKYKSIFKITIYENILSCLLESVFVKQLKELKENLVLIYIKDQEKILILFKSFFPLLNNEDKQVKLPYWDFLLDAKDFSDRLQILFRDDENICIMTYIINNN
jgi:hypothetical protein